MNIDVLSELTEIIEDRKKSDPADSYVASLNHQGLNKILESCNLIFGVAALFSYINTNKIK